MERIAKNNFSQKLFFMDFVVDLFRVLEGLEPVFLVFATLKTGLTIYRFFCTLRGSRIPSPQKVEGG